MIGRLSFSGAPPTMVPREAESDKSDGSDRSDKSDYVVAVLPATHYVNLDKTREALQAQTVELASEIEMAERCPDCEVGTLPPFGSQYEMRTIVDSLLTADEEMIFEGNTHSEAIRMKSRDFLAVEKPLVAPIS